MPNMSSEQLRDLSIRVVESFLNDRVPLSEGLAKQAAAYDLNSEQVHRCVEACNTISFLKIMGAAKDRTFEFPLCDYSDVMMKAAMPDMTKLASHTSAGTKDSTSVQEGLEKVAHEATPLSHSEQVNIFTKEAAVNSRALEDLECRATHLVTSILKTAADVRADSAALDKLACVVGSSDAYAITSLVFGKSETLKDFGNGKALMFKQAELKSVTTLNDLYKEARLVRDEINSRRDLQERMGSVKEGLMKSAFASSIARGAGKALGSSVGAIAAGAGKMATKPFSSLAKTTSYAAKRAVGRAAPPKSITEKTLGGLGVLGLNSTMIDTHPGFSAAGRSRDVWEALQ